MPDTSARVPDTPAVAFADVTPAQWAALGQRRIYFGHQSVGGNIMDGVEAVLRDHPAIPVRVVLAEALDSTSGPGLYHARIGHNGDPGSKAAALAAIVDAGHPGVAALKYCYVDVTARTDPDSLFADYQRRVGEIRARHPDLVFVHVTMPLTTVENWKGLLVSRLRGRTTEQELNVIRNRYNRRLLAAYAGKEPVFDLSRVESTAPDGSRVTYTRGGDTWLALAPAWTDDGGHLNTEGRRRAAEAFLALLATLPGGPAT